jgi:hypothetical protein
MVRVRTMLFVTTVTCAVAVEAGSALALEG